MSVRARATRAVSASDTGSKCRPPTPARSGGAHRRCHLIITHPTVNFTDTAFITPQSLRSNKFDDAGVTALGEALKINTALTNLTCVRTLAELGGEVCPRPLCSVLWG